MKVVTAVFAAAIACAAAARAQTAVPSPPDMSCPTGTGIVVRTDAGSDDIRPPRSLPFDTTFRFDVRERQWTRATYAASLGIGLGPVDAGTAGASAGTEPWRVCAGAGLSMRAPTLSIHGATGSLYLHLDPASLAVPPVRSDSPVRPRR